MPNPEPMQTKTSQALGQADKELKKTEFRISLRGPQ
jgi:hypothetical protein